MLVMLSLTVKERTLSAYGDYNGAYQTVGLLVSLGSTAMIFVGLAFPSVYDAWMPPAHAVREALGHEQGRGEDGGSLFDSRGDNSVEMATVSAVPAKTVGASKDPVNNEGPGEDPGAEEAGEDTPLHHQRVSV